MSLSPKVTIALLACALFVGCVHQVMAPNGNCAQAHQDGPPQTIVGFVTDVNGDPLNGVNVSVEGFDLGDATRPDGRFLIANVPAGRRVLTAGYMGFLAVKETVSVRTDQQTFVVFNLFEDKTHDIIFDRSRP